jgi:hypothetical protein
VVGDGECEWCVSLSLILTLIREFYERSGTFLWAECGLCLGFV